MDSLMKWNDDKDDPLEFVRRLAKNECYRYACFISFPPMEEMLIKRFVKLPDRTVELNYREALYLFVLLRHCRDYSARKNPDGTTNYTLREADLIRPASLAHTLQNGLTATARFVKSAILAGNLKLYQDLASNSLPTPVLRRILTEELNRLLAKPDFYQKPRFSGIKLSKATDRLIQSHPTEADRLRLNRLLLEDAFPGEITRMPPAFLPMPEVIKQMDLLDEEQDEDAAGLGAGADDIFKIRCSLKAKLGEENWALLELRRQVGMRLSIPYQFIDFLV